MDEANPRRRWYQFSLAGMLALLAWFALLVALLMYVAAARRNQETRARESAATRSKKARAEGARRAFLEAQQAKGTP